MKLTQIKNDLSLKLRGLSANKRAVTAAAAAGIAGMILILMSGGNADENRDNTAERSGENICTEQYKLRTEQQLEELLSAIDGVGKADVMIMLSGSEEYSYAVSITADEDRSETEYVTVRGSSGEEPVLTNIKAPVITGVAVVCTGGDSDIVKEKVYNAVTSLTGLSSTSVYVTKGNP